MNVETKEDGIVRVTWPNSGEWYELEQAELEWAAEKETRYWWEKVINRIKSTWRWHVWPFIRNWSTLGPPRMFIQRGRRGFSDEDLWSFDMYVAPLIARALRVYITKTMGWPGQDERWPTFESWVEYVNDLADRLEHWNADNFIDLKAFEVTRNAMEEFGSMHDHFWI